MERFRPMLAASVTDLSALRYPLFASPKLDGIRCVILPDGSPVSRSLKPIPNLYVTERLSKANLAGLDGELVVVESGKIAPFRVTSSVIMSRDKKAEFQFHVFDVISSEVASQRVSAAKTRVSLAQQSSSFLRLVPQTLVNTQEELQEMELHMLGEGYEGVVVKPVDGIYKFGRATKHDQCLVKIKRFQDSEAEVIGVVGLEKNYNPSHLNELGLKKRSHHKCNKVMTSAVGALQVRDRYTGIEFELGTGFTAEERLRFYNDPTIVGKMVKYKYLSVGVKHKPRHPVYLGVRHEDDM